MELQTLTQSLLDNMVCKAHIRKQILYSILSFWHLELREKMENLQKLFSCKQPNFTHETQFFFLSDSPLITNKFIFSLVKKSEVCCHYCQMSCIQTPKTTTKKMKPTLKFISQSGIYLTASLCTVINGMMIRQHVFIHGLL